MESKSDVDDESMRSMEAEFPLNAKTLPCFSPFTGDHGGTMTPFLSRVLALL